MPAFKTTLKDKSPEERERIARMGGKASVEARKRKRNLREQLKMLLSIRDKSGLTNHEKACLALINKALTGDTKAFEVLRDTIGEKPIEKVSNRIGSAKNGGLKIILLGEDSAKRNSNSAKEEAKQDPVPSGL